MTDRYDPQADLDEALRLIAEAAERIERLARIVEAQKRRPEPQPWWQSEYAASETRGRSS